MKNNTYQEIAEMLDALDSPRQALSPWEEHFLENIAIRLEEEHSLTEHQLETLRQLYREKAWS